MRLSHAMHRDVPSLTRAWQVPQNAFGHPLANCLGLPGRVRTRPQDLGQRTWKG